MKEPPPHQRRPLRGLPQTRAGRLTSDLQAGRGRHLGGRDVHGARIPPPDPLQHQRVAVAFVGDFVEAVVVEGRPIE